MIAVVTSVSSLTGWIWWYRTRSPRSIISYYMVVRRSHALVPHPNFAAKSMSDIVR
jgi:hypothetical protein